MNTRWKAVARCVGGMLSNVAVIGFGVALYEQKVWPTLIIAGCAALVACAIAWRMHNG